MTTMIYGQIKICTGNRAWLETILVPFQIRFSAPSSEGHDHRIPMPNADTLTRFLPSCCTCLDNNDGLFEVCCSLSPLSQLPFLPRPIGQFVREVVSILYIFKESTFNIVVMPASTCPQKITKIPYFEILPLQINKFHVRVVAVYLCLLSPWRSQNCSKRIPWFF